MVVLDLEDAVAPEAKDAARSAACAAVKDYGEREVVGRINSPSTPWGKADLEAVSRAAPDAVLLPKVEHAADIAAARSSVPLWVMIETPLGVANAKEIAAVPGIDVIFAEDRRCAASLPDRRNLWWALSQRVTAARPWPLRDRRQLQ